MIIKNVILLVDPETGETKAVNSPDSELPVTVRVRKMHEIVDNCNIEFRPMQPCEVPTKRVLEGVTVKGGNIDGSFEITWKNEREEPMTEADWEQLEEWEAQLGDG